MATLAITADRALTGDGAHGPTRVIAEDGLIVAVGDPTAIAIPAGATHLDWSHRAMVPGTVNTHNHSFQSLLRGIGDDLPFLAWRDRALLSLLPEADRARHGHRGAVRVRRDAAPRRHHGLRLLLRQRTGQRPRVGHDRGRAPARDPRRARALLLRLGRAPRPRIARRSRRRSRTTRRSTSAIAIPIATSSRSSRRRTASTARLPR